MSEVIRNKDVTDTEEVEEICEECGGDIVSHDASGERVCDACGLVVESETIDHGPEWRSFEGDDTNERRVGSPMNNLLHDKGLTTQISSFDKDAKGNLIDGDKRKQINRLRERQKWIKASTGEEQNLRVALGEIKRMGSALGLPKQVRETASVIYRQCLNENVLPGRSIEEVSAACVYAAARKVGYPRSLDDVREVSRVHTVDNPSGDHFHAGLGNMYRDICNEIGLQIPPSNPRDFIGQICSSIDATVDEGTKQKTVELIELATEHNIHSGCSPVSIAAGALYCACGVTGVNVTQSDIASSANVSTVTIRNKYREISEVAELDRDEIRQDHASF